jgi:hypothetical protein
MRPGFQSSERTYRNPIIEIHQRLPITYQSFSKIAKPFLPAREARSHDTSVRQLSLRNYIAIECQRFGMYRVTGNDRTYRQAE